MNRLGDVLSHRSWWRGGVIYQIYPRSWCDSNGDGIGDLRGVIDKLQYLQWLGVDGIWLNPIMPSADRDWGYDVSNYEAVHPVMGSIEDFDELIAKAAECGICVVFDLVPSHTSDEHPWFIDARTSKTSRYRDYYVWRSPGLDGAAPNNWKGYFGGPAWSFDERSGEYYLHNFSPHQPQLNWWNTEVRLEFDHILNFWFKRRVRGVRVDAVQALLYDKKFRDNPPASPSDSDKERQIGQRFKYNANRPEVHEVINRWRALANRVHPPALLFGETWVSSLEEMIKYYGSGRDEFDLAWNVPFLRSRFAAGPLRKIIGQTLALLPHDAWPTWAMSTHDSEGRAATRWCRGVPNAIRCALVILLTLRGTPILYYGDEIGMMDAPEYILQQAKRDKMQSGKSRDFTRTPMQWNANPGAGFTTSTNPWLPINSAGTTNVEAQLADSHSVLWLVHDLLSLRRNCNDLAVGALAFTSSPPGTLVWRRGEATFIGVNIGSATRHLKIKGRIMICTDRARDRDLVRGSLELRPLEAVIVKATD